ncbi:exodeoxyribonuclease III [Chlorobium phaeobacteroides]|jgi:exodeoxyribonuclease-3|uniref:Exodeoxyribonuclease III Xth n=1 Tax=Chlorobium phaeobacteroides (strain DSM 266 / SMG 266 / 2430) TaxID=290317 RepID=A1BJC4_CHLPD|nr:exodeoxyribonuclease III [Chlorobium phaeobacteroides]ABL66501.1 exodeoxyribonuclease III Xth [Chlorobium phaeobacteroides DSM 266]
MKIASWNVNGIRARQEALVSWIGRNSPDVLVLQEVKADLADIPASISELEGYDSFWNGSSFRKGYSGTGMLVRKGAFSGTVEWEIPAFDFENRTCVLHTGQFTLTGCYVPRGEGDEHYRLKLRYFEQTRLFIENLLLEGRQIVFTGDMNVAHRDIDVHRSQNKPGAVGLRAEERSSIDACLALGLRDVMRERAPERNDLFTWWPYWKNARERNLGWRIDCFFLSAAIAERVTMVAVDRDERSSDHAPIILELSDLS